MEIDSNLAAIDERACVVIADQINVTNKRAIIKISKVRQRKLAIRRFDKYRDNLLFIIGEDFAEHKLNEFNHARFDRN